ncbi:MAG: methyltransferase domain-containing protein [Sediminibacterium sp.]|nr:methyltransferase domain-containing protein [Sediminibacterium sp.]
MVTDDWFLDWFNSDYYHLLYKHRDEQEADAFIRKLIAHLQPAPGSRMVDVACGKGRHSKILSDFGFDVTGIDLSASSIQAASMMENDRLHFLQHDMRNPFWVNYFDYAFNFFTSFGYFRTRREHDNAIRSLAGCLKKGGKIIIDYINVPKAAQQPPQTYLQEESAEKITFQISKWQDEHHFYKQIQIKNTPDSAMRHLYTEKVAKFTLHDFSEMLGYCGLQLQEIFGDYQLHPYESHHSERMIMIATKIK